MSSEVLLEQENRTYGKQVSGNLDKELDMEPPPHKTPCPECGSNKRFRDYKRAEVVCEECGLVIEDKIIDLGPEWRVFESGDLERTWLENEN